MNKRPINIRYHVAGFLAFFFLGGLMAGAVQREEGNVPVQIPKLTERIKVDAKLDDPAWKKALKMGLEYETEPGENIPAPVKTDLYIFYNRTHVYFALMCYDPNTRAIRARYSKRDEIHFDDLININLDTFNDQRQNYFFGCNPLGVQRDGTETTHGNQSWDAIWDSAGAITDEGYIIEMAIPFSSLQFQRKKGPQVWGLDISRWYPRDYRHRLGLVKISRNNNSYQGQFLKIVGFEDVKPGKNIEIIPTVTGIKTDSRDPFPEGDYYNDTKKVDPGLTAKWGITPNLTVNGTVNPDFSQVEADSRQLDINQPFALFFEEKRPFFTEGADFFKSPLNIVYTRSMRDPSWGLKISGKEGKNTIGAYLVRDNITNLLFPGSQGSMGTSLSMDSTAAVLRYKRDFGTRYMLGAIVTSREGGDYSNRVFGIDGVARLDRRNKLEFQFLGSATEYPGETAAEYGQPGGTFWDRAFQLEYDYNSRNINMEAFYVDIGKDFRADLGFVPRVGYRVYGGEASYRWLKADSWWSIFQVGGEYQYARMDDGSFMEDEQELWFNFNGIMQSRLFVEAQWNRENYNGEIYKIFQVFNSVEMQPLRDIQLWFNCSFGDQIDYANSRLGNRFRAGGRMIYNLGRRIKLQLDQTYEKMKVNGQSLYRANITQGMLIYHLNSRVFFRGIFQYVDYKYNVDNYTFAMEPEYQDLFTQLLFSYRLNPRTVLFLGYSDNYEGSRDFALTRKNRTLFFKVSYSWQM